MSDDGSNQGAGAVAEQAQSFGCDRCGHPREAHEGDELRCPGKPGWSAAKWSESVRWTDDGHAFTAVFSFDAFTIKLICPEHGCPPTWCSHCRTEDGEIVKPDCAHCGGTGNDPDMPCWLQHYASEDAVFFQESTRWAMPVDLTDGPVPILWHSGYEEINWRPKSPQALPHPAETAST